MRLNNYLNQLNVVCDLCNNASWHVFTCPQALKCIIGPSVHDTDALRAEDFWQYLHELENCCEVFPSCHFWAQIICFRCSSQSQDSPWIASSII